MLAAIDLHGATGSASPTVPRGTPSRLTAAAACAVRRPPERPSDQSPSGIRRTSPVPGAAPLLDTYAAPCPSVMPVGVTSRPAEPGRVPSDADPT